jgi:hypothetical protein
MSKTYTIVSPPPPPSGHDDLLFLILSLLKKPPGFSDVAKFEMIIFAGTLEKLKVSGK